ncbi:ABC-F family ATP-binding cassette domain-containing protein [Aerococcaceae bacterium NML190073]|nr:ABC-F family ATP-binding cassette domain-containing protein [Aerococcaceae bacterium NML190073]MCW6666356.1 ABC-F family ATP-binding cassette domain-containing protein [Aerococcaceae bacterium NML190938]
MKELTVEHLHKTYGTKTLLKDIQFAIRTGDRVGLIGPNGTGKSSFLKVLAGIDHYDDGMISKPNEYSIAYLDQNPQLNPEQTILETVYDSQAPIIQLLLHYEQLRLQLEIHPHDAFLLKQFNQLTEEINLKGAWDAEVRAKAILTQLGLKEMTRKVGECSGGEQKRIGIAQVLIADPDLLILDEPTNHLDMQSVQWLEKYLANYKGALLLVTHDRYFLERAVNKIVELRFGKLSEYEGNYQTYLEKRAEEAVLQQRMQEKQDKLFQQELAWMRKGAKARTTKQQARIERFDNLKADIQGRDQAVSGFSFDFEQQRVGNRIMELEQATVAIGEQIVLRNYSKIFVKGERIGIVGHNGVGKTTFLNTLAGLHSISEGTYDIGQTVRLAYYRQLDEDLPDEMRVLNYLTKVADNFKRPDGSQVSAAQLLEQFNFPRATHGTEIKYLSGGERRRLYLLSLLVQQPNVLLLDEPTNDLDIDTLTVLEDYLLNFDGVVLVVSHDRYFLDKTVEQLLEIRGDGEFATYWGNYSDYLEIKAQETTVTAPTAKSQPQTTTHQDTKTKRLSYHEKKEWASIEADIAQTESRIETLQEEMNTITTDAGKLMDLQRELEQQEAQLLHYYERYEYLSELADS